MKRLLLIVVLVAGFAGLHGGAAAASTSRTVLDTVQGTEASVGTISGNTRIGVMFGGATNGTLPGQFTTTVTYTPSSPVCSGVNTITGGTWSLTATDGGTISGTVAAGSSVRFSFLCALGNVTVELTVTGGTGAYSHVTGSGAFTGLLDHIPLLFGQPATLTGVIHLQVSQP